MSRRRTFSLTKKGCGPRRSALHSTPSVKWNWPIDENPGASAKAGFFCAAAFAGKMRVTRGGCARASWFGMVTRDGPG
jgi:hypothetical protein